MAAEGSDDDVAAGGSGRHNARDSSDRRTRRSRQRRTGGRRSLPGWLETIVLLVVALLLAMGVKTFLVESFYVPSGSMEPTLQGDPTGTQDRILVQKVSYWRGQPQRGDVVVFSDPGHWLSAEEAGGPTTGMQKGLSWVGLFPSGGHLVKRVIGVGGDTVKCCDSSGRLQVNGTSLEEPFVRQPDATSQTPFQVVVPRGDLWVMGDNRGNSQDSRAHQDEPGGGFVPVADVTGKVALVVWPWRDRAVLHDPPSFATIK